MGAARLYRFGTPYNADQLAGFTFAQTANKMYFAHLDRPPQRLTRNAHTDWSFAAVTFGPTIIAPGGVSVSPTQPESGSPTEHKYVVTAVAASGQESRASAVATASNDLTLEGNFNTVSWDAVTDADSYSVYRDSGFGYGYIGTTESLTLKDGSPQIIAQTDTAPPRGQNPFDGEGNYPAVVTLHEQRAVYARTRNAPNAIFGSQSADPENFDFARPARPDDAYSFALLGKRVNAVNQLLSSSSLVALTTDSIFTVTGSDGNAIGPANAPTIKRESGRGVSTLPAIDVDEVTFIQPIQGSSVRALGFSFEIDGIRSNDVSIFSPHLFEGDTIVAWAYQDQPNSCVWAVMQSGMMLCFTWQREQDVWGWTRIETAGKFEDVTVITENGLDRVYVTVRREINGVEKRFYERMAVPHGADYTTACHLDCAVTQVYQTAQREVSGLWHLNGETVSAFYDGYVAENLIVENGAVTLPFAANVVTVGLPYVAEIETLPLVLATSRGSQHVSRQTIGHATVRAVDTKGIEIAVAGAEFEPVREREAQPMGFLPNIDARDYPVSLPSTWSDAATIVIRQPRPLPMHITGLFLEPLVGDD